MSKKDKEIFDSYASGNPNQRFDLIYKNYHTFPKLIDSFETGVFNMILNEREYNRIVGGNMQRKILGKIILIVIGILFIVVTIFFVMSHKKEMIIEKANKAGLNVEFSMCKDGKMRYNFIASVSKASAKTFRDKVKALEIHKRTGCKINMIAELLNPMLRGWTNYFGKFNPSAMKYTLQCVERRLVKWAMCKYKNFRGHRRRAEKWLSSVRKREPRLFAHWSYMYSYC